MKTVRVQAEKPYEVLIERGLMARAGEALLDALGKPCAVAVLTDDTVGALYGAKVRGALEGAGFRTCVHAMPHGEKHKNAEAWLGMLDFLAENRLTRADCVVALGGGVAGDVAGFAAASYLRGVRLVQMPTTLLAMVDSSVGGKTGFDLAAGKNLAGAFYQPLTVLCDPDALATLTSDTLADGAAEAIKYGVLGDEGLFNELAAGQWRGNAESVIERCVAMKAALVADDEHDTGKRQLLNLGHTVGHAIEKRSDYAISHGHAVAMGMVCAARLSHRLGLCGAEVEEKITQALASNGLPARQPYPASELTDAALSDKKRLGDSLTFVLPRRVGACELVPVKVSELGAWLALATGEEA